MSFTTADTVHHFGGGVYAKEMRMPADYILLHHRHKFDHLSVLASGSIELIVNGERKVIHAPACLTITSNVHHGARTLTDVVWYCIHATESTDVDEIDAGTTLPDNMAEARSVAQTLSRGT